MEQIVSNQKLSVRQATLSGSNNRLTKQEYSDKLDTWVHESTNAQAEGNIVAEMMRQAHEQNATQINLKNASITTYPPFYPGLTDFIVTQCPQLLGVSPQSNIKVHYSSTMPEHDKEYVSKLVEWVKGDTDNQGSRLKVAGEMLRAFGDNASNITLNTTGIDAYPPTYSGLTHLTVKQSPALFDAPQLLGVQVLYTQ